LPRRSGDWGVPLVRLAAAAASGPCPDLGAAPRELAWRRYPRRHKAGHWVAWRSDARAEAFAPHPRPEQLTGLPIKRWL